MFCGFSFGDLIRFGDIDRDSPSELVAARFVPIGSGALLIEIVILHDRFERAERDDEWILPARMSRPIDGFSGTLRGNPDGRPRPLVRPRPYVDVAEIVVIALEGK